METLGKMVSMMESHTIEFCGIPRVVRDIAIYNGIDLIHAIDFTAQLVHEGKLFYHPTGKEILIASFPMKEE